MQKIQILTLFSIFNIININASGFENAFKRNLKRERTNNNTNIPVARPVEANNNNASRNIPMATINTQNSSLPTVYATVIPENHVFAQTKEERKYFSMKPAVQTMMLNHLKQTGEYEKMGLEVASFLISSYKKLENNYDPHREYITNKDKQDLIPHLKSVKIRLNEGNQTPEVIAKKRELEAILQNHR